MTELPEEPKDRRLSDEILNVWSKSDSAAYQAAAREITLSRVHITRLQSNLDTSLVMTKNSVEREGACQVEINRLREGLRTIIENSPQDAHNTAVVLLEESYRL